MQLPCVGNCGGTEPSACLSGLAKDLAGIGSRGRAGYGPWY